MGLNKCVCGSSEIEDLFNKRRWMCLKEVYKYVKCKNCGIVRCFPSPSKEILKKLYSEVYDYSWYKKRARLKKFQALHRVLRLNIFLKKYHVNKILDIGCGHGYFVNALLKQGFDAYGYDVSKLFNLLCKNHLFFGSSYEIIPEKNFDMITLWDSLEHMGRNVSDLMGLGKKLICYDFDLRSPQK